MACLDERPRTRNADAPKNGAEMRSLMDIQYHYFAVRTLAEYGGFSEEEAQTIAYYSQQVDDFTQAGPFYVAGEPPAFFTENGFAGHVTDNIWMVVPHPTGIDMVQSLEEHYRYTTLAPFHFIPPENLEETGRQENFSRADYRCVCASNRERALLIHKITGDAVSRVKESRSERNLMELGMALHTYADTYAHCGYSGLSGWENRAVIKKAFNQTTQKEEVSNIERLFYQELPHIGHGNSGHVPDICSYQIEVATLSEKEDKNYSEHIRKDNLESFLQCSRDILDILCDASGAALFDDNAWEKLSGKLSAALPVQTSEESSKKKKELAAHWSRYFPDISYSYEKSERFFEKEGVFSDKAADVVQYPTDAFYDFNELSYQRAKIVSGSREKLETNKELLMEALQNYGNVMALQEGGAENAMPQGSADDKMQDASPTESADGKAQDSVPEENSKVPADRLDTWQPKTRLGLAVRDAGFAYSSENDILYSPTDTTQRSFGYCRAYDEAAAAVGVVADCAQVFFLYDGYEWVLELRKGQYGIGTGCEAGLYYRKENQPETEAERTVTGKQYFSLPEEKWMDMRLLLRGKEGEELLRRDWTKHWWLTGWKWGIFSNPEELSMTAALRFPNEKMKNAFLEGADNAGRTLEGYGLKALGYTWTKPEAGTIQFDFVVPSVRQYAIRNMLRDKMQELNKELTGSYRRIRESCPVSGNHPDAVDEMLSKHAGIKGKRLYEKLLIYYERKAEFREQIRNTALI